MKQVKMNFSCALPRAVQGGPEEYFRTECHSKALHSQGMWILCSRVSRWTQKCMSTQLKLSFSGLASHCVSVQPQELFLDLFLVKQNCWKCFQASSWGSAYSSLEMSSSLLITDPKSHLHTCAPNLSVPGTSELEFSAPKVCLGLSEFLINWSQSSQTFYYQSLAEKWHHRGRDSHSVP